MDRLELQQIATYQFGAGAGRTLFADSDLSVTRTSSGRPRQIHAPDGRLATYGTDGRFRLGLAGGHRLQEVWSDPDETAYRVEVGAESVPYVREERNAFAKFVTAVDPIVRPGDEVIVEHDGELLAVGRAELPAADMMDFERGVAVSVREGAEESNVE